MAARRLRREFIDPVQQAAHGFVDVGRAGVACHSGQLIMAPPGKIRRTVNDAQHLPGALLESVSGSPVELAKATTAARRRLVCATTLTMPPCSL